jgi:inner membrane protein
MAANAMPSIFTHAAVGLSIGCCFYPKVSKRVLAIGAVCSVMPDLDVIGFGFGVHYGDFLGHRGFTHSLVFAALLAGAVSLLYLRRDGGAPNLLPIWVYLFLATASHGFLDAMTDGGLGVAFFAPFDNTRYFFPWTPVRVAPIGLFRFFSMRGVSVFASEFVWIWIPAGLLAAAGRILRQQSLKPQT